jgi:hypothetical protein
VSATRAVQYVRGDTYRSLRWTVTLGGVVQDITGWTAHVQLTSKELPGVEIDLEGTNLEGTVAGTFEWPGFGNSITAEQLGVRTVAHFTGRFRGVDPDSKVAYTEEIAVDILAPPLPV